MEERRANLVRGSLAHLTGKTRDMLQGLISYSEDQWQQLHLSITACPGIRIHKGLHSLQYGIKNIIVSQGIIICSEDNSAAAGYETGF